MFDFFRDTGICVYLQFSFNSDMTLKNIERQLSVFLIETDSFLMMLNCILLEDLIVYKLLNYNLSKLIIFQKYES